MLCSSGIRRAYGPNGTLGPGLGANPLGSVVAVVNIVAEKSPDSFGSLGRNAGCEERNHEEDGRRIEFCRHGSIYCMRLARLAVTLHH